jgi:hypothetical protein
MTTAITLALGRGRPIALVAALAAEMITAVAATMGEGRGSMGSTGGGMVQGGTGRRRGEGEGHLRMAGTTKRIRMKMRHLDFGGSDEAVGGVMR